jgi:hypothetical protein
VDVKVSSASYVRKSSGSFLNYALAHCPHGPPVFFVRDSTDMERISQPKRLSSDR